MRGAGVSLADVVRGAGVSYEQLKKIRQRGEGTRIEYAIKVAVYFGLSIEAFLDEPPGSDPREMTSI